MVGAYPIRCPKCGQIPFLPNYTVAEPVCACNGFVIVVYGYSSYDYMREEDDTPPYKPPKGKIRIPLKEKLPSPVNPRVSERFNDWIATTQRRG